MSDIVLHSAPVSTISRRWRAMNSCKRASSVMRDIWFVTSATAAVAMLEEGEALPAQVATGEDTDTVRNPFA